MTSQIVLNKCRNHGLFRIPLLPLSQDNELRVIQGQVVASNMSEYKFLIYAF